ncbi:30S ribosomal protein S17e [Methanosarcinales archaeon ex4572_44]|nr:MAG: 30S ribosomal protein S17e [Methanosarcinales archaeon ex4484_138]PHP45707.1 MAG: 30S ribosomal protein S17e [Methanosarcinales archaeon ex4572_44]RLG25139.1 MAG: 30S ribosomal protein S17e [Methanosarcinales archaeon]HHI30524.1 30S ribosomal protein S17e [Candidatus Methanoperedenaceae archaeon]
MGNIRPTYIKRLAAKLLLEHGDEFSVDFDSNKEKVVEYTNVRGKSIRNRVAGCIVREKRIESRER